MILLKFLGWMWLFPATVLYWAFYILPLILAGDIKYVGKADTYVFLFLLVSKKSRYARMWRKWLGWSGPCVIIVRSAKVALAEYGLSERAIENIKARTQLHELRHCHQRFVLGIFFDPIYILIAAIWWLRGKHAHLEHPLEIDARKFAGQKVSVDRSEWPDGPQDYWPWW